PKQIRTVGKVILRICDDKVETVKPYARLTHLNKFCSSLGLPPDPQGHRGCAATYGQHQIWPRWHQWTRSIDINLSEGRTQKTKVIVVETAEFQTFCFIWQAQGISDREYLRIVAELFRREYPNMWLPCHFDIGTGRHGVSKSVSGILGNSISDDAEAFSR